MKRNILFLVAGLLFSIQLQAGGPWPTPKNGGFFKLSQWWVVADKHYTDTGLTDPNITSAIYNTSLYAEYGLTDRLTGILYFPLFSRALFNNEISGTTGELVTQGEAINSIGDTDIGLKYGIIVNKPVVLSASLYLGLPLGIDSGGSTGTLQTGDGEFNQLLQIDIGTSFGVGGINFYSSAYGGFNNRTNGFSDEIRYGIEGGATLPKTGITAILRLYGIKSLKNGDSTEMPNSTSIFANNSEHFTISPEIAYQFNDKWGVSATYAQALSGRIIFANPSYSFGVFLKI
ncbi:MAG: hypothetical protein KTR30_09285 [Saprospiraceae bacterium]|nr:hypothetical protein [Saprospiraceae bacterium]